MIEKYKIILPAETKEYVTFKIGKLKILDKKSLLKFIDSVSELDLLEVEKEVKLNVPKGKWSTFNFSKIKNNNYSHF